MPLEPALKTLHPRLINAGKTYKLPLVICARKLLIYANTSSTAADHGPKCRPQLMVATLLAARSVNTYVRSVTSAEFKRWLERQGASFEPAKGGHIWVLLRGRRAILPCTAAVKK